MHQDFLNRFSSYHKNSPFIIQLYFQLHKGGRNESCKFSFQQIREKKMPALTAYNRIECRRTSKCIDLFMCT